MVAIISDLYKGSNLQKIKTLALKVLMCHWCQGQHEDSKHIANLRRSVDPVGPLGSGSLDHPLIDQLFLDESTSHSEGIATFQPIPPVHLSSFRLKYPIVPFIVRDALFTSCAQCRSCQCHEK